MIIHPMRFRLRANNVLAIFYFSITIFLFVQYQRRAGDSYSGKEQILKLIPPKMLKVEVQNTTVIPLECQCKSQKTGKLYDFCYRLPENNTIKGKKFSCEWLEKWEKIETDIKLINPETDDIPEPVFVTAFNDPFWRNGLRLISSIRKQGYNNRIILYDLGIKPEKLEKITNTTCNVEIRKFNFSAYPHYMKNLKEYRWKPIVIAETLRDFGAIWYLDSSLIFQKSNVSHVYRLVNCHRNVTDRPSMLSDAQRDLREGREEHEDGWNREVWERNLKECRKSHYLLHGYSGHGILSVTNPGVYSYFPTNPSQLKKQKAKMYDAGFVYTVASRETIMDVLKWYFLCALQEDCMAPKGSVLICHFPDGDRFRHYSQCHRFDQSIINLILANRYFYDRRYYVSEIVDFFQIDRGGTVHVDVPSLGCH